MGERGKTIRAVFVISVVLAMLCSVYAVYIDWMLWMVIPVMVAQLLKRKSVWLILPMVLSLRPLIGLVFPRVMPLFFPFLLYERWLQPIVYLILWVIGGLAWLALRREEAGRQGAFKTKLWAFSSRILMLIPLIYLINLFTGNPISAKIYQIRMERYVAEHYEEELKVSFPSHDLYNGKYYAEVVSEETGETLCWLVVYVGQSGGGKIIGPWGS